MTIVEGIMAVLSKEIFSNYVEHLIAFEDLSVIDAVLAGCEKFNVDPELSKDLLSDQIIEKLRIYAKIDIDTRNKITL